MFCRAALPFGLLAAIYGFSFAAPGYAQHPRVLERCAPPSTMLPPATRAVSDQELHRSKMIIERVTSDRPIHLPDSAVAQARAKVNDNDWSAASVCRS
jgi:hypothetical protein